MYNLKCHSLPQRGTIIETRWAVIRSHKNSSNKGKVIYNYKQCFLWYRALLLVLIMELKAFWFRLLGQADQRWACQNHGRVYRVWRSTSQCLQQRRWPSGHDGWSVMWSFQQKCPRKLSCIENCRLNLHVCRSPGQKPSIFRELLIIISAQMANCKF